ncbi:MAG TPA: head maturation protease, ClpP-related [Polyangia bacterium]|jgi:ATP-dependent protease ClpP protease subunit|nr:head maturation protease, ClpP-related [Polyangia bacterium]
MPKREHFKTARLTATLRQGRGDWYKISNNADTGVAEVAIYDEVGYFGVTASDFIAELKAIDARQINLHISSPGGEVFDGFAIFEALRAHRATVTTYVDSLAASIASVIAMAGDRIIVGQFAEFMIHEAAGLCIGNASDMQKMVDDLNRESTRIAAVYADRAGGTVDEWRSRMEVETWFSAEEAVKFGLADEVAKPSRREDQPADPTEPEPAMAAKWDLSVFRYAGRDAAPTPRPVAAKAAKSAPPPQPPAPVAHDVALCASIGAAIGEGVAAAIRNAVTPVAEPAPTPAPAVEPAAPVAPAAVEPSAEDPPEPVADPAEPVEPAVEEPEPAVPAAEPVTPEPAVEPPASEPGADPEPEQQPEADEWTAVVAHLTQPPAPDDWAALTQHLTQPSSAATAA